MVALAVAILAPSRVIQPLHFRNCAPCSAQHAKSIGTANVGDRLNGPTTTQLSGITTSARCVMAR